MINYLKPFQPGEPIDTANLNELIRTVNMLAAEVSRLTGIQVGLQTNVLINPNPGSTNTGGSSSTTSPTDGQSNARPGVETKSIKLFKQVISMKDAGKAIERTLTEDAIARRVESSFRYKSYNITNVKIDAVYFRPRNSQNTEPTSPANAVDLIVRGWTGKRYTLIARTKTPYREGQPGFGPLRNGPASFTNLFFDIEFTVDFTV